MPARETIIIMFIQRLYFRSSFALSPTWIHNADDNDVNRER